MCIHAVLHCFGTIHEIKLVYLYASIFNYFCRVCFRPKFQKMPALSTVWRISFRGSVKEKCQWEFIMKRAKVRGEGIEEIRLGSLALCCQSAENPPAVPALE